MQSLLKKKPADLQKMLSEERAKLYNLRVKNSVNPQKNTNEIRQIKTGIARILTAINARKDADQE